MDLKDVLEKIRSSACPPNEASAKFHVIAPILRALGWDDSDGEQVLFEYSVGGGKKGGRVDIALKGKGKVLALIEAKAPNADLDTHVEQVLGYAFYEGVELCVLSTGQEWWLYLPLESGPPPKRRFAVLKLDEDPLEQLAEDFERFLGKNNLSSGQSHSQAKRVLDASLEADRLGTEMPKIWNQMLRGPDEELVELIGRRVYYKLSIRPSNEQVRAVLHNLPVPQAASALQAASAPPTYHGAPQGKVEVTKPSPSVSPVSTTKPIEMVLWGQRHPVKSYADILRIVTEKLYERHAAEFHKLLELKGTKRPFVARDRNALIKPEISYEVASAGYFVDMNLSRASIRKRAEVFLDCFGYPPSDLDVVSA
ncbi:MAG: hypothetical protein OXF21_05300 [bacterium]|nr:hypothetical protein [bacterium]